MGEVDDRAQWPLGALRSRSAPVQDVVPRAFERSPSIQRCAVQSLLCRFVRRNSLDPAGARAGRVAGLASKQYSALGGTLDAPPERHDGSRRSGPDPAIQDALHRCRGGKGRSEQGVFVRRDSLAAECRPVSVVPGRRQRRQPPGLGPARAPVCRVPSQGRAGDSVFRRHPADLD